MKQEDVDKIYKELAEYEKEIESHNSKFLDDLGEDAVNDFEELMDCCNVTEKIKLVDAPKGTRNNENIGVFLDVYVNQWCTNMEGDSFSGFLYANVKGKWVEIPYSC